MGTIRKGIGERVRGGSKEGGSRKKGCWHFGGREISCGKSVAGKNNVRIMLLRKMIAT